MKLAARLLTALTLLAFATPALPCGFDKSHGTTTTTAPTQAPAAPVAKAGKVEKAGAAKAKAPAAKKPATTASSASY